MRNAYRVLFGSSEVKKPFGRQFIFLLASKILNIKLYKTITLLGVLCGRLYNTVTRPERKTWIEGI